VLGDVLEKVEPERLRERTRYVPTTVAGTEAPAPKATDCR
jgi:hypothetical protein